jgi:hypothetical protein
MHEGWQWILAAWVAAVIVAPATLAATGRRGRSRAKGGERVLAPSLAYLIAFDLAFIAQELALVIPKALVPGLHPVLFHNNHDWTGDAPVAELLQGTGALADILLGLLALAWRPRNPGLRLVVVWFAFSALVQGLGQGVVAAMLPGNDVGRAEMYLGFPAVVRLAVAALSVIAMIGLLRVVAIRLAEAGVGAPVAAISMIAGTILIIPYRVPGSVDQVVIVPVAVALIGGGWLLWWLSRVPVAAVGRASVAWLAALAIAVLLVFQLVLRRGIAF